jgi:hypothetical protein
MIYDITVTYEDEDFRDVAVDMALEDYAHDCYRLSVIYDKAEDTVKLCDVDFCEDNDDEFHYVPTNELPEWVRRLSEHLTPRASAMARGEITKPIKSFVEAL